MKNEPKTCDCPLMPLISTSCDGKKNDVIGKILEEIKMQLGNSLGGILTLQHHAEKP